MRTSTASTIAKPEDLEKLVKSNIYQFIMFVMFIELDLADLNLPLLEGHWGCT